MNYANLAQMDANGFSLPKKVRFSYIERQICRVINIVMLVFSVVQDVFRTTRFAAALEAALDNARNEIVAALNAAGAGAFLNRIWETIQLVFLSQNDGESFVAREMHHLVPLVDANNNQLFDNPQVNGGQIVDNRSLVSDGVQLRRNNPITMRFMIVSSSLVRAEGYLFPFARTVVSQREAYVSQELHSEILSEVVSFVDNMDFRALREKIDAYCKRESTINLNRFTTVRADTGLYSFLHVLRVAQLRGKYPYFDLNGTLISPPNFTLPENSFATILA